MKKFIAAILAFVYLGVSSGIAMNVHYCMGKISSVDLSHSNDKCGKCGMKNGKEGCCKDEVKIVKISDAHKLISNEVKFSSPAAILPDFKGYCKNDLVLSASSSMLCDHSPPHYSRTSLTILYRVFRI